jgi:hypothetical protein
MVSSFCNNFLWFAKKLYTVKHFLAAEVGAVASTLLALQFLSNVHLYLQAFSLQFWGGETTKELSVSFLCVVNSSVFDRITIAAVAAVSGR